MRFRTVLLLMILNILWGATWLSIIAYMLYLIGKGLYGMAVGGSL